jgi:FlaA1/EpsC-like NDP-sugar epimerase
MGESVRIVDLARDMIRLSGFGEDDVIIIDTGLRPGEKLFEEVLADGEQTLATPHPKLRIAQARKVEPEWLAAALKWLQESGCPEDRAVRGALKRWVPEYREAGDTPSLQTRSAPVGAHGEEI